MNGKYFTSAFQIIMLALCLIIVGCENPVNIMEESEHPSVSLSDGGDTGDNKVVHRQLRKELLKE
ncbi:hypothetical protein FACS1894102_0670 [Spirochaetia bacterium]|nr:hypothetical protein FACS1894102_0670 [Spirochaetia bacterium]